MRNVNTITAEKPERTGPLRKPRRRWWNNIETYLIEIRFDGVDWIHSVPSLTTTKTKFSRNISLKVRTLIFTFLGSCLGITFVVSNRVVLELVVMVAVVVVRGEKYYYYYY
jgi:hypothetical protein